MGIYYRTEACGCVTAGTTYAPGSWVAEPCNREDCARIRAAAHRDAKDADEAEALIDLARRLPDFTAARLAYLRNM